MLSEVLSYGSMTAKIKAMQSRLIDKKAYYELAALSSVRDVGNFLKQNTAYGSLLSDMDEQQLHRGELEQHLHLALYDNYMKIYSFATPKQRPFLKVYFKKYEIQLLKQRIRLLFVKEDLPYDLKRVPDHFVKRSDVPFEALSHCTTINDLFDAIAHTEYEPVLGYIKDIPGATFFDYGLALDIYYFKYLWRQKDKVLNKKDQAMMTAILGPEIDLLNISWIYRSWKYYTIPPAVMKTYLIPIRYKLSDQVLDTLMAARNDGEFFARLKETYYGRRYATVIARYALGNDSYDIQHMHRAIITKIHQDAARKHPYSLAMINNYLYTMEAEISKLTTVLECIRYGYDSKEIVKYVL